MIVYRIGILPLIKNLKQETWCHTALVCWRRPSFRCVHETWDIFWFANTRQDKRPGMGYISPNRPRAYWSYARRISRLEKCSEIVTYLRCARAHIILGVTSGTTSPNVIGWEKSVRWRGRRTSTWSAKPRGNTPRRVTPQWYVQSNLSGYLFQQRVTWNTGDRSREWRKWFGKPFCLVSERWKPSYPL